MAEQGPIKVVSYAGLSPQDRERYFPNGAYWQVHMVDGQTLTDWAQVVDPQYGAFEHVVVIDSVRNRAFDKADFLGKGVFPLIYRKNPNKDNRVEFLLPRERRPLLDDENGVRGNVEIINMTQGNLFNRQGEDPHEVAREEIVDETGLEPEELILLRGVYWDTANSRIKHPVFLARVPFGKGKAQNLEDTEQISVGERHWYTIDELLRMEELECGKTMASLWLATGALGLWHRETPA